MLAETEFIRVRGWTLDVLNSVRRLCEVGTPRRGVRGRLGQPSLPNQRTSRRDVPTNTFTTADAYVFTRELEQLHPDNPVNNTGQESASNSKSCVMPDY